MFTFNSQARLTFGFTGPWLTVRLSAMSSTIAFGIAVIAVASRNSARGGVQDDASGARERSGRWRGLLDSHHRSQLNAYVVWRRALVLIGVEPVRRLSSRTLRLRRAARS